MLRRTFQLVPGIGASREREAWQAGFDSWEKLPPPGGDARLFSAKHGERLRERIALARAALEARDLPALAAMLPERARWRLWPDFEGEAVFFDIETDGRRRMAPTVVSLFSGSGFEVYLAGRNMEALPGALARHRLWVTFNGLAFDVPVLREWFGTTFPKPALHLDLRVLARRVGWHGGLKSIEDQLGHGRPPHLRGVNGLDAVLLWREYRRSANLAALRLLVEYNLYDAIQLRTVMDAVYNRAVEATGLPEPTRRVFERGDVLYDVSRYLLALSPTEADERLLARLRSRDRDIRDD